MKEHGRTPEEQRVMVVKAMCLSFRPALTARNLSAAAAVEVAEVWGEAGYRCETIQEDEGALRWSVHGVLTDPQLRTQAEARGG